MTKSTEPAGFPARRIAAERLAMVLAGAAFEPIEAGVLADPRERALANRLVTTALRRHGQIDLMIAELLERGIPKKSGRFEAVLRIGLAQLVFLPELGAHSALFLSVEAIKREPKTRHLAGLMNAALRRAQANSARYGTMAGTTLFPSWLAERFEAAFGPEAIEAFADALIEGAPLDLTQRGADPALADELGGVAIGTETVRVATRSAAVRDLPGFAEGRWWVQDVAATIPAALLGVEPGQRVLDLCAAPGGKTAQLLARGATVTALDADPTRVERLEDNLERLGMAAEIVVGDALAYRPAEAFDAVLLDAPCTASGTFRRHPEVLWRVSPETLADRAVLQRRMLNAAARLVRPGGVLVYAVCSLLEEEGEAQHAWALETLAGFVDHPVYPGELPGFPGAVTPQGAVRTHPALVPDGPEGAVEGGMDGFYVFRLRRAEGPAPT